MKKYLVLLLLVISYQVNGQGIEFFHGTWEEAKEKATQEEKILFVDAFTTWCGPCKRMAKNVFTDPDVGAFFNEKYISLKLDMEKTEGRAFSAEYPVSAYPTLFFINEKGELLKKVVGGKSAEQFLAIGKSIVESYDRSGDYKKLYDEGSRDFDLVLNYIKALNNANKPSLKIANDFLRENKDLTASAKAEFLFESLIAADSRIFSLFIKERSTIEEKYGVEKVEEKIEEACWTTLRNAIDFESQELLSEAKQKMSDHLSKQAASFGNSADYEYAKALADIELLNNSAIRIAKSDAKKDAERLHDICNELLQYEKINSSVISSSEKIAKMAVDESNQSEYLLTYSKILFANNKSKKAVRTAKKALSNSEDPKERKRIEEWISQLESD